MMPGAGGRAAWAGVMIGWLVFVLPAVANPDRIEFNRDIRPILSNHCFACHGFDAAERKAGLRLDTREGALGNGGEGAVIAPGSPGRSELWRRISSTDRDELMPPPESNKPLTSEQKQLLRRWIEEGAEYQPHWSFAPVREVALPEPAVPHPIDRFIIARLVKAGLEPGAPADRATLVRRVTLDLTGLPPTPEEIDTFLADRGEDAYGRLVDRLMARRDYAERRAQDWLDLARYADTRGFADDRRREIWPYRDWVVRALHRNMPFDQFTIEQLAGDMLPGATDEQRLATGFHRNAPQARGQTYPVEEYRLKGVTDRVNTTGKVWLGMTLECSECHDHKFDPISQRDYFSMFAIFNNIEHHGSGMGQGGPTMKYRPPAGRELELAAERQRVSEELSAEWQRLPEPPSPGEAGLIERWEAPEVAAEEARFDLTGNLTITARIETGQRVANILSKYDWRAGQRSYVFGIGGEGEAEAAPGHLFFWVSSRNHPFDGVSIYGSFPVNDAREHLVAVVFEAGESARFFVDGIEDTAARVTGKAPASIAVADRRLAIGSGYRGGELADAFRFEGGLGEVRLYGRALAEGELRLAEGGEKVERLLGMLRESGAGEVGSVVKPVEVPVMKELPRARETFIHRRGNFLDRGDRVSPGIPSVLASGGDRPVRDRLELARWLVDGEHPLVARVVVNRIWQGYFGHGLVRTADDFGSQGTPPTHPQLLDWLAAEFVDSGWDMKHLNRLIVTSATYRRSARITPQMSERDPENLLLARMPRTRLPAEQIRDQALAVSGLLRPSPGGASVFPAQPDGYWEERDLPGKWVASQGDDAYRKSLYTYWRRMALHPTMELLDAPSRAVCVVRRHASNLPTQALVTLNAPVFVAAAEHLARRIIRSAGSDRERIELAFKLCLGRAPEPSEQLKFLDFLSRGDAGSGPVEASELARWRSIATVLLNLDETITRP